LGIFVGSGSRSETDATAGATHMLEHMAFKASDNRSHFRTIHEVEHMGAGLLATAGREEIVYTSEILNEKTPALLEIMADVIQTPAFMEHEVEEQKEVVRVALQEAQHNSQNLTTEAAHLAAYGNNGLGRSLLASNKALNNLNGEILRAHAANILTAGNVVVAAAGVEHEAFVKQVEGAFQALPSTPAPSVEASKYEGGQYAVPTDSADGLTHVVLAFEGPSWHDPELIPMCVLHTLMGGGSSFSAGGPGKGMYSRLYTNVLNKHGWVQNATAFNSCYNDSGLFGVYGATDARNVPSLVSVLSEQLAGMAGAVSDEELSRAKNMTKSSVLMNLESKPIILEDLGKQVLCYGKRLSAAEVCSQIDKVSAADIQKVAKKMMSTQLTYSALGEVHALPRYDVVANSFK
jgi:processing peptidase subunit alpha